MSLEELVGIEEGAKKNAKSAAEAASDYRDKLAELAEKREQKAAAAAVKASKATDVLAKATAAAERAFEHATPILPPLIHQMAALPAHGADWPRGLQHHGRSGQAVWRHVRAGL